MHLHECEVAHRHVRGHNAIFIFGPRALTADEAAALGAEYTASYGTEHQPAYCSPDGWQLLHAAPVIAEPALADESAATAPTVSAQPDPTPTDAGEAIKKPRSKK